MMDEHITRVFVSQITLCNEQYLPRALCREKSAIDLLLIDF
jgi:hypothetical protein